MEEVRDRDLSICEKLFMRGLSSFLAVTIVNMLTLSSDWSNINYVKDVSTITLVLSFIVFFIWISAVVYLLKKLKFKNADALFFVLFSVAAGFFMLMEKQSVYLSLITIVFVLMAVGYAANRFPIALRKITLSNGVQYVALAVLLAATLIYVGSLVVLRYFLFKTPNFDFGIFSQMYYYMKETGLPITTCERNCYLSHFAIHFSPIYYLILPVYMVFPHPVTLIIMQLLIVFSGAVPVYLMCRKRRYSGLLTFGLTAVFIFYPTMRSGLFYDFHENKFLPPLLLWLLYFIDSFDMKAFKRNSGIAVFMLLSLMVKEDAAIYTACTGLYVLASRKERPEKIKGFLIFDFSVLYFLIVFFCLNKYGAGSAINSIGRYENLMTDSGEGLADMLLNMLKNPAYVIKQLMSAEKLEFIIWTMGPLLFVPFFVRKFSVYILMIPYMVMNLLTNYGYQYDIGFQYTFGSCTLLIYIVIIWFEGRDSIFKRKMIVMMSAASLLFSVNSIAGKNAYYDELPEGYEYCREIFELFEEIPKDASVEAATWFVPALSQREEIYEIDRNGAKDADYIVLDLRSSSARNNSKSIVEKKLQEGYEVFAELENKVIILRKNVDR